MDQKLSIASKAKVIMLAMLGNFLEFYDFALFGIMVPLISTHFFGTHNDIAALIKSLLVLTIGFLARPLGAILFGHIGDRIGRKKALMFAILTMAGATLGIGISPSYEEIGILAPILLCVCRLAQGLSTGGEGYGAVVLVLEHFPQRQRGLAGSIMAAATISGVILATGIGSLLTSQIAAGVFPPHAWRWAFIGGALIGVVSFIMRSFMKESPLFEQAERTNTLSKQPFLDVIRFAPKQLTLTILVSAVSGALQLTFAGFITIYLHKFLGFDFSTALAINAGCLLCYALIMLPTAGYLSDRMQPSHLMLGAAIAAAISLYPIFGLVQTKTPLLIIGAQLWLGVITAFIIAPKNLLLFRLFKTQIRYSGLSFSYAAGISLFGGFTPLICTYLVEQQLSPALFPIACAALSAISLIWLVRLKTTSIYAGDNESIARPTLISSKKKPATTDPNPLKIASGQ